MEPRLKQQLFFQARHHLILRHNPFYTSFHSIPSAHLLGDEPAWSEVVLRQQHRHLRRHKRHQREAPHRAGLHAHEVPRAAKDVERYGEAGQRYADDVVQVERAAGVADDGGDDLRDPEGVEEEEEQAQRGAEAVDEEDAAEKEAVCGRSGPCEEEKGREKGGRGRHCQPRHD